MRINICTNAVCLESRQKYYENLNIICVCMRNIAVLFTSEVGQILEEHPEVLNHDLEVLAEQCY